MIGRRCMTGYKGRSGDLLTGSDHSGQSPLLSGELFRWRISVAKWPQFMEVASTPASCGLVYSLTKEAMCRGESLNTTIPGRCSR